MDVGVEIGTQAVFAFGPLQNGADKKNGTGYQLEERQAHLGLLFLGIGPPRWLFGFPVVFLGIGPPTERSSCWFPFKLIKKWGTSSKRERSPPSDPSTWYRGCASCTTRPAQSCKLPSPKFCKEPNKGRPFHQMGKPLYKSMGCWVHVKMGSKNMCCFSCLFSTVNLS